MTLPSDDIEATRRGMRDLMGLLALPALWAGRDGSGVLQSMAEAIESMVPLAFSYVHIGEVPDSAAFVRLRIDGMPADDEALEAWQNAMTGWGRSFTSNAQVHAYDTPIGPMRVVTLSLGYMSSAGSVWFGSPDHHFPTTQQISVLRAAATMAANGLQTARISYEREAASRAKDEFLAMLGHELRNPLAPISAAAELLQFAKLDDAQLKVTSAIIARQVVHMTSLVNDLLDVSRVSSGMVLIEKVALALNAVVRDAIEQARPLIEERSHRFTVHMQPDSVVVMGDHKLLVQVFANLLSNAAKYTPTGGNIELHVEVGNDQVIVVVSDDGIGIDQQLIPTVFDLFTQAKRSSDRSQGGLGLGLALVKNLVGLHGGTVSASSGGLGAGSRFSVHLQRLPPAQRIAPKAFHPPHEDSEHPLRILVVDDNIDGALMVAMLLEALGHEVLVENDAFKALERAGVAEPDVCLLDIGLPGMDGNELARRLRGMPRTRKAVLIAVTGYGQETDRELSREAGFDHHFVKPLNLDKLKVLLVNIASQRFDERHRANKGAPQVNDASLACKCACLHLKHLFRTPLLSAYQYGTMKFLFISSCPSYKHRSLDRRKFSRISAAPRNRAILRLPSPGFRSTP